MDMQVLYHLLDLLDYAGNDRYAGICRICGITGIR